MSAPHPRPDLPQRAAETSAEQPWPVRLLSVKVGEYVDKMSVCWVEGQVVQLTRRPGRGTAYLTLRDTDVDMSFSVAIRTTALDAMPPLQPGARVVTQVKPVFWPRGGSLQLDARQIRPVGIGELLARLEQLRTTLAAEGLFDRDRKRPLPFLPRTIGLVTGRGSAAERDVVENARRRWPSARFALREVAVQGPTAVTEVCAALADLDEEPEVDVIVIARGGGSIEDLLPFSNEALLRAVSAATTPVVSAIGHDVDTPLLDLVADARASTPTDAASLVVPDAAQQAAIVGTARERLRTILTAHVHRERERLHHLRSRPVMADPGAYVRAQREVVQGLRGRANHRVEARLTRERDGITHLRRHARALSPQATLDRGYAIVAEADGTLVRDPEALDVDDLLRVVVAHGDFAVRVVGADA
ncbi:MAG: exodeoxyribonuclease VII large subunit [Dermatophilaceae bacterium]